MHFVSIKFSILMTFSHRFISKVEDKLRGRRSHITNYVVLFWYLSRIKTSDQDASNCLLRHRVCSFLIVGVHRRSWEQVFEIVVPAIMHWEKTNKVFGKLSAWLLDRLLVIFNLVRLLVVWAFHIVVKNETMLNDIGVVTLLSVRNKRTTISLSYVSYYSI